MKLNRETMVLLLRTAYKNILGAGIRTWLNVCILSFVLVIMVVYNSLLDGWLDKACVESKEWEFASGQLWSGHYDPYDALSLSDAHDLIPEILQAQIKEHALAPVLIVPASIFPQGRMVSVQLKGLDSQQELVKIPIPSSVETGEIPVVLGKQMAKSLSLKEGDIFLTRWRDRNGTFDARSMKVVKVFHTDNQNVDKGQIWMRLDQLQALTLLEGEASYLICKEEMPLDTDCEGWHFKDLNILMKDFLLVQEAGRMKAMVVFVVLLGLALLAVFDTQVLSIFKRKKEIGTYVALGMEPKHVVWLFTIEGMLYSLLAIGLGIIWGVPFLYWFHEVGYSIPSGSLAEVAFSHVIYPTFHVLSILVTVLVVVVMSGVISYFPARKIAQMNMVLALKGKME